VAEHLPAELPPEVELGPAAGEDAALIRIGGELWAVASDPVSFTAEDAGRLAVIVNANDVAVRGARPTFFVAVILVGETEASEARVRDLLHQVSTTCGRLGVTLIGGHTEVTPGLGYSLVVGTMLGPVVDRPITTGGLEDGDLVGMTRSAGLEGTAILMAEFGDRFRALHGDDFGVTDTARPDERLSVVPEALAAAANPSVTALHDVTEGGVGEALNELGRASGLVVEVRIGDIPVLPETRTMCADLGIDPLGLIGSGSLLVGCREEGRNPLAKSLAELDVPLTWIGRAARRRTGAGEPVPGFPRDEILKAFAVADLEAVVFDMDGTLVESEYDWPSIRQRLGVAGPSIIDDLNGMSDPQRSRRWAELESIERTATDGATLKEGVRPLLALLARAGTATALVTNNSESNTRRLIDRFGLSFDVVVTRDSGMWKPSGAPIAQAVQRLGATPQRCLVVGDSRYDAEAGHDAGCGAVCLLYGGAQSYDGEVALRFPDLAGLTRYLEVVL
jgi:HAD superfamily hydrolase (TIGR01509 family)